MSYAIIIENDRSVYFGEDPVSIEWGFINIEEARESIAERRENDEAAGARQVYHIVLTEETVRH